MSKEPEKPKHPLVNFLCHPMSGTAIGIIGIALAVYFYLETIEKPNLTYYVSQTRIPIVQTNILGSEEVNNFSVTYYGNHVGGNVSAAEVQIWNQGKKPIRGGDVINGGDIRNIITIRTQHGEPIYNATYTTNRDAIGFNWINFTNKQFGILQMDWKILEQGDGIKLQIYYGGDVNISITVDGTIVGQSHLTQYKETDNSKSPKQLIRLLLVTNTLILLIFFKNEYEKYRKTGKTVFRLVPLIVGIILGMLSASIALFHYSKPPFGF